MYIDDGDAVQAGDLGTDVDDQEYTERENCSHTYDTVVADAADGGHLVYTDTAHTGTADWLVEYDADGRPLRQAYFDVETGQWIDADPSEMASLEAEASIDTAAAGELATGSAAVDAAVDAGGEDVEDTVLYADTTGGSRADTATEIAPHDQVIIAPHGGDHEWATVQRGQLDVDGRCHRDETSRGEFTPPIGATGDKARSRDTSADRHWSAITFGGSLGSVLGSRGGVVRIDATTGQWISPN